MKVTASAILRYQIIVTHLSNVGTCVRHSHVSYGNDGALGTFKRSQTAPLAIGGVVRYSHISYGNDGALGTFNVFRSSANGDLKLLFWLLEVLSSFMRIDLHLNNGHWLVFVISPGK